jgi:hypothetical protein
MPLRSGSSRADGLFIRDIMARLSVSKASVYRIQTSARTLVRPGVGIDARRLQVGMAESLSVRQG